MKIDLQRITIRELVDGFKDLNEDGVVGCGGLLDIRPPYQRYFIYDDAPRNKVIDTVRKGFPLNVMYWVKSARRRELPNTAPLTAPLPAPAEAREEVAIDVQQAAKVLRTPYEVLDGQQRAMSICLFVTNKFSIAEPVAGQEDRVLYFDNLTSNQKEEFLNYELMVYLCEGTDSDKLDWFTTINIAGKPLYEQELRNAVYTGPWLTDAKRYFSRAGCEAYAEGSKYITGELNRQDYLETALKWVNNGDISGYMAARQQDANAKPLREHFIGILRWVVKHFPDHSSEMKGVDWGSLYRKHGSKTFDAAALARIRAQVLELRADEDVTRKSGIYDYVLCTNATERALAERHLSIRAFPESVKVAQHARQGGKCATSTCQVSKPIKEMEADHTTPWSQGGRTVESNCRMLCKACNRLKSGV